MVTGCSKFKRWKMEFFAASRDQKRWKFLHVLLMEEILHHLGCKKTPVDNGINYQPQLFSRISSINSMLAPCEKLPHSDATSLSFHDNL